MTPNEAQELLDRTRRIETRLTTFLVSQGFEVHATMPVWSNGVITIPSMGCSIRDIMKAIPEDWCSEDDVAVTHRGDAIAYIFPPEKMK